MAVLDRQPRVIIHDLRRGGGGGGGRALAIVLSCLVACSVRILGFLLYFNDPNDPIYKHFFRGGKSEANREVVCVLRVVCIGLVHETLLYSTKFQSDLKLNSIFDR